MPIYEYECEKCAHRFEVMQKFSDTPISECEICKGNVRKVISPSAIVFKGSGWYVTDYSSKYKDKGSSSDNGKTESKKKEPSDTKKPEDSAKQPLTEATVSSSSKK
ncbi:MAG: FmdB family zinc ribbon protein [Nitrospirota bacterium]